MNHFLAWVLIAYSFSNIVVVSKIALPIRNFFILNKNKGFNYIGNLLSCMMCFGFWSGVILHLINFPLTDNLFLDGLAGSGASWLLHGLAFKLLTYEYTRQHPPAQ